MHRWRINMLNANVSNSNCFFWKILAFYIFKPQILSLHTKEKSLQLAFPLCGFAVCHIDGYVGPLHVKNENILILGAVVDSRSYRHCSFSVIHRPYACLFLTSAPKIYVTPKGLSSKNTTTKVCFQFPYIVYFHPHALYCLWPFWWLWILPILLFSPYSSWPFSGYFWNDFPMVPMTYFY